MDFWPIVKFTAGAFYPLFTVTIFTYRRMLKRGFHGFHGTLTRLHSLKSLILYSTSVASTGSPLVVEYFVKSLRFCEEEAVAIVNKVSYPFKSAEKPELVVDFLKESGIDETHIRKVVAGFPNVLRYNVAQTLKPKIRFLHELGFSGSDLGLILSQHPYLLERNLEGDIGPAIGVLKSLCGSDEQLVRFMLQVRRNGFRFVGWAKNLPSNIILLQNYGFTVEQIKGMLCKAFPSFCTKWDEKILKRVEEKLFIPRTSAMFIYGLKALSIKSEEDMESWLQVFRSYGWSESEINRMLTGHPLCLCMSEQLLRVKLEYFMHDLGCGSDYLARVPVILSFSMEKRILPRVAIIQTLKDKHLLKHTFTPYTYLKMTDLKFKEKYVLPYKSELPDLEEKIGCSPLKA